jgi:hypothetical protein
MTEAELLEQISGQLDVVLEAAMLMLDFLKLCAFALWAGVGYVSLRLLIKYNWRIA